MNSIFRPMAIIASLLPLFIEQTVRAQETVNAPERTLGTVTVNSGVPSSLPTQIPITIESVTRQQIENTINATDSEDAIKYLPSLNIRRRYIGDYDHAVLASRASGTGNSARSLVYADGILLSNLLGNGASFTPRWGMVTPEEIERVDVLYGPFSAAYPGNSVGAVVDYVTRMPREFESHAKLAVFSQRFKLYSSEQTYNGGQASASVGNKNGDWSWWFNVNQLHSNGQPIAFANRLVSAGTAGTAGAPVSGAVEGRNPRNQDWLLLGSTSQTRTIQDHAKFKVAYDLSPTVRASYTLGWWRNEADRSSQTYLRDAAGNPVYSGSVNISGRQYTLNAADFAPSRAQLEHLIHGLSLKSNTKGVWDWEIAASVYDYANDTVRSPTVALPAASSGGAGRITDQAGTGWQSIALSGLFDVNFRVAQQPACIHFCARDAVGIPAELTDCLGHRDAFRIHALQVFHIERPRQRATAEISALIPHAFLIRKTDDLNRKRQPRLGFVEMLNAGDGNKHTERPVEFPGIANCVQMRSEQENLSVRRRGGIVADEITDGVRANAHSRLTHPRADEIIRATHGRRAVGAREFAIVLADLGERVNALHDKLGKLGMGHL